MGKKKIKNNFEEDLSRLEKISNLLESKEIGLDDAILLFEEGIKLSKTCITNLKKAELKISKLKSELSDIALDEDDEFVED
ncbi:MAG: exodeoxyribonuclease VII small subunit [Bacteroidetes bacterium]|nr:exodeoxyribonuclease VII small subunit [Bacteroidota bacterium]